MGTTRLGVGVYKDGRVDVVLCIKDGPFIPTTIDDWRQANQKIEELAKLAGV